MIEAGCPVPGIKFIMKHDLISEIVWYSVKRQGRGADYL